MNEHHKIEEKIEQSKISNECIILFERELSAAELENFKIKSGSRIFEQPMFSPPFLLRILEECYGWEIPDDATFYHAFDYHSILFLTLSDPAPLLIYRNEKKTENFLKLYWSRTATPYGTCMIVKNFDFFSSNSRYRKQ